MQYGGAGGLTLVSAYDALNRLASLTQGTSVTSYAYDLNGNIVTKTLPNADAMTSSYDALNRAVTVINTRGSGGAPLSSYVYDYDLAGNVKRVTEGYSNSGWDRVVANTYDAVNRLTQEAVTGSGALVTSFGYDNGNNRTSMTRGSTTTTYTYNALNQLTQFKEGASRTVNFAYDRAGNRLTRTEGASTDHYSYDFENRLTGLTKQSAGGSGTYSWLYDYRTRRVQLALGSTTTQVSFSGGVSVREYENGALSVDYVRGSDWGGGVGGILYTERAGVPSFTHYNRRGDVTAKTDATGNITYQATYEAFGKRVNETGSTADRQKSNTKDEDIPGYANEGFRFRDLETGCFISRDPAGFVDGPNLYAYVVQNPWTKFDPEGLADWSTNAKAAVGPYLDAAANFVWGVPYMLSRGGDYAHHFANGGSIFNEAQMSETSVALARQLDPHAKAGWYNGSDPTNILVKTTTEVALGVGVSKASTFAKGGEVTASAKVTQETTEAMVELQHGTTMKRAQNIAANGPDATFVEPGGMLTSQQGFSTAKPGISLENPIDYALDKAAAFPDEGGPALLRMQMPESMVNFGSDLGGNEIRFNKPGTDALRFDWDKVKTTVEPVKQVDDVKTE